MVTFAVFLQDKARRNTQEGLAAVVTAVDAVIGAVDPREVAVVTAVKSAEDTPGA